MGYSQVFVSDFREIPRHLQINGAVSDDNFATRSGDGSEQCWLNSSRIRKRQSGFTIFLKGGRRMIVMTYRIITNSNAA
jgi:hypothetical protein